MRPENALRNVLAMLALLTSTATAAMGEGPVIPEASLPLMERVPTIDGTIDEAEWSEALRVVGFHRRREQLEARRGMFWLGSDGRMLYVAVKTETPPIGELNARVAPAPGRPRPLIIRDDGIELWFAPRLTATQGDRRFYQVIVNSRGAVEAIAFDPDNPQQQRDTGWDIDWEFASTIVDGWWHAEMAIPLASLNVDAAALDHPWGVRIGRNWQQPPGQTEWSPRIGSYTDRGTMPVVRWSEQGPLVRMLHLRDPETDQGVHLGLELVNRGDRATELALEVHHQSADSPARHIERTYRLGPGERERFTLEDDVRVGRCATSIFVRSPDGKQTYFSRRFQWDAERPDRLWTAEQREAEAVALDFGYYPYYRKLKVRLDISSLSSRAAVTGATLTLRREDEDEPIVQAPFDAFEDARSEMVIDLPPLEAGTYVMQAKLAGDGVPAEPATRTFEREVFEWEHNDLGITDEVIPPFTPLAVEDHEVHSVLRHHTANDQGLWDQVLSEGETLLAAPMRFDVRIAGRDEPVRIVEPLRFTETRPNRVVGQNRWRAGSLEARVNGEYDVDGMLKLTMNLTQHEDEPVEQLDLVIPINARIASLMHAAETGLRHNFAGYLPAGEGLIWESREANRRGLEGTFVPYVWIGNEAQGICWFADNDRDWLYDDVTSTHRIYREGDQIVLRVSFVTRAAPLGRDRTLVFGIQATPTKPMPGEGKAWRNWLERIVDEGKEPDQWTPREHWRNWLARSVHLDFPPRVFHHFIFAGPASWGSLGNDASMYPRDRDYTIYELMAQVRASGERDREAEEHWIAGYDESHEHYERLINHVRWAMRALELQPDAAVPYTNPRGVLFNPEFATFQDEWLTSAYSNRNWPKDDPRGGMQYNATPTRSYQDYRLWYTKKMLETWADAIYFDNTFPQFSTDIVTRAYVADDGSVRPGTDIFAMRELLKRTQTLTWQVGGNWLASVAHMTNTQIAPINTWVGVNLEWEDRYSVEDFQDRFSRDMIRTTAIGRQTGSIPLVLADTGIRGSATPERRAFVERTLLGMSLLHELRPFGMRSHRDIWKLFFEFGYGLEDCQVHRYWDQAFPVTIDGIDAEALLLVRDGEALMLITSFDDDGQAIVTIEPDAGLAPGLSFRNMETNAILERSGEHTFQMQLNRHDFAVVGYQRGTNP